MKRFITILLAILMVVCPLISASAMSGDPAVTGKTVVEFNDWIIEKINSGTQWELDEYKGTAAEVIAPRMIDNMLVVSFGSHCFANNTTIKSVVTSSPLWTIGEYAFIDCTALESIELNYALNTIETGAFSGTASLKNINLETSVVKKINPNTFLNSGVEEITLPETCTEIGKYAFGQCKSLKKITIPSTVTTIDADAFAGSDSVVIYCYRDSAAHAFAVEKNIDYRLLGDDSCYVCGDADGDGKVTINDATYVQMVLAKLVSADEKAIMRADFLNIGKYNIVDATIIQRWLAHFGDPIGEHIGDLLWYPDNV